VIALAVHNLRRVTRHRAVLVGILALPIACGLARAAFPTSAYTLGAAWACPFVTGAVAWAAVWFQRAIDDATGLSDALRSSPLGSRGVAASRLLAALLLFLFPTAIFWLILAAT
jgi:hypothetical protein